MRAEFWHERWEKSEIGFHQPDFNTYMQKFIGRLELRKAAHVLVPLCGKSLDMLWLAEQGYRVTGIELSERAAKDFFAENKLSCEIVERGGMKIYRGVDIEIWCADFFAVNTMDSAEIDAVYDRAALVALPPEMRPSYTGQLTDLIRSGVAILLITLDYPQEEMKGPPFSVSPSEVQDLFQANFEIEYLWGEERLSAEPRFRKKGLTRMDEHVFILRKNGLPASKF